MFPAKPIRTADQDAHAWGCALLTYILLADVEVYGFLTDDDLALVDHVARVAVTGRDILPCAVDRISMIRHRILHSLTWRNAITAVECTVVPPAVAPDFPPAGTSRVPLTPLPRTNPPAAAMAIPAWEF
jgi:hypothetical protein